MIKTKKEIWKEYQHVLDLKNFKDAEKHGNEQYEFIKPVVVPKFEVVDLGLMPVKEALELKDEVTAKNIVKKIRKKRVK